MSYPGTIDSFTPKVDDSDDVLAAHVNKLQVATAAIETELGTDPAGSRTDVKTRLAHLMSAAGYLEFDQETLLTISSGAITVTQNLHRIETEAGAASDNLDTINGHSNGLFLIVRASNDAHTVVIRHDEGNILCTGGANISLDSTDELAWGYYDGTLSKWILMRGLSGEALTGSGADNQVAVFTGASTLDSSDKLAFTGTQLISGSDSYPVSSTPQIIAMSESGWGAMGVLGYGSGNGAYLSMYTARGTNASPTATQADDLLGRWVGGGYDASADWAAFSAALEMYATENFDGSSHGSKIVIKATEDGSITPATVITIEGDKVSIGALTETTRQLFVDGSSNEVQLKVQGHSTQTANLFNFQDSAGNSVFYGTDDGIVSLNNPSTTAYPALNFYGVSETGWQGPVFQSSRKHGSGAVQNADVLFNIKASGWDGSAYGESATIMLNAEGNASSGSTPGQIDIKVTPSGSTTAVNTLRFYSDKRVYFYGKVGVGVYNPSGKCHIKGDADDQQLIVQAYSTQTVNIMEVQDSAGNADIFVINRYERMGFGESNPGAKAHISQSDVAGDCPTLLLMQYDVDKEIVYFGGTAASGNLTRNLVDEGDQSSTTLEGWIKINVQDDGNQITDATYYIPFYTLA